MLAATRAERKMLFATLRILLTIVLACIATLAVFSTPFVAASFLDAIFGPPDVRGLGRFLSFLANMVLYLPVVLQYVLPFGLLWLPVLVMCRRASHTARDWAVILAPLPIFVIAFGIENYKILLHQKPSIEFHFLGVMVFVAPAMMMIAAFFFYFDRAAGKMFGSSEKSE